MRDWIYNENGAPKYWPVDNYYILGERITSFLGCEVKKTASHPDADPDGAFEQRLRVESSEEINRKNMGGFYNERF